MDDQPAKKRDWAITFLSRLCLIGWVCAILYETFDFLKPVRQLCLLFGPWACVIALLNGLVLFLIRRQAIFLFFMLVATPPMLHFGLVLRNIVIEKQLINAKPPASSVETEQRGETKVLEPKSSVRDRD